MAVLRVLSVAVLGLSSLMALPAAAQADPGQCILAGRLDAGRWAPRMGGVQLLGDNGRVIGASTREALAGVRQVRLAQPALLARCDGNAALHRADDEPAGRKAPGPAVSAGVVDVESVAFPKLRIGGELVELKVRVPQERIVALSR